MRGRRMATATCMASSLIVKSMKRRSHTWVLSKLDDVWIWGQLFKAGLALTLGTLLRRAFVLWKLMRYFQNISQIIIKLRNIS